MDGVDNDNDGKTDEDIAATPPTLEPPGDYNEITCNFDFSVMNAGMNRTWYYVDLVFALMTQCGYVSLSSFMTSWLVVFNAPSTARSFRDGILIYCPLRRT